MRRIPRAIILPDYVKGRDRRVNVDPDGSLYYTDTDDPENLRNITGYERDPADPKRFQRKWPDCRYRHENWVRYPRCGCLGVIMRCCKIDSGHYGDRLDLTHCQKCSYAL